MFCKHLKYKILKILYGDNITWAGNKRQICQYEKCHKIFRQ